jgi:hypothetical protein
MVTCYQVVTENNETLTGVPLQEAFEFVTSTIDYSNGIISYTTMDCRIPADPVDFNQVINEQVDAEYQFSS